MQMKQKLKYHLETKYSLAWDPPAGTKPKPLAPATTPLVSMGPSVGGFGNVTGPVQASTWIILFLKILNIHEWHSMIC